MEILIFLWALEKLSNSLYCSFNKHFLQSCWYYLKFRIRGIQNDFIINNYVTEVIYMIFWYARYFEYCIYFLKLCFYFLNLRKESLSLIKQISTSTIIFTYTCLDVSPGEGLEIRECSRIGSFLEPSYACLGEPNLHGCRFGQGSVRKEAMKGGGPFVITAEDPGAAPAIDILPALIGSPHLNTEQVGPQICQGHPPSAHTHIPTSLHRYPSPCFPHIQPGRRVTGYQSGRHLPSCSHLYIDRVHCCRLDSDRRTRHRKQPRAHLTASTSSCTWRRRL